MAGCVRNKSLIRFVAVLQENMVGLSEDYLRLSQENNYPSSSGNDVDDVDSPTNQQHPTIYSPAN